jgi:hypothetical protein
MRYLAAILRLTSPNVARISSAAEHPVRTVALAPRPYPPSSDRQTMGYVPRWG